MVESYPEPLQASANPCADDNQKVVANPYSTLELEQMLRNFKLRRNLGLLPGDKAPAETSELRWIRKAWLPQKALSGANSTSAQKGIRRSPAETQQYQATLLSEISDMQQKMEQGYSELNAERRAQGALAEGLRRQGESLAAITDECSRLKQELSTVQKEVQDRIVENQRLSHDLGALRQSHASGLTQAALLESTIRQLENTEAKDGAKISQDLAMCRSLIASLVEENEFLEKQIKLKEDSTSTHPGHLTKNFPGPASLGSAAFPTSTSTGYPKAALPVGFQLSCGTAAAGGGIPIGRANPPYMSTLGMTPYNSAAQAHVGSQPAFDISNGTCQSSGVPSNT